MRRLLTHLALLEVLVVISAAGDVRAQIDAPRPIEQVEREADTYAEDPEPPSDPGLEDEGDPVVPPPLDAVPKSERPSEQKAAPARPAAKKPEPAPEAPQKSGPTAPAPVRVTRKKDADLLKVWDAWRKAEQGLDRPGADAAMKQLLSLKAELGITDLESFSVAVARAANKRVEANDAVGGIELARHAVSLAPGLPYAHFALARTYFTSSPAEVGRWGGALGATLKAFVAEPRYLRPAVADIVTALLAALLATAAAIVVILFARRVRYFLHDFHHLFPRAAARWQTVPLALLILALPAVFRLGLIPILLALFLAVTLYLEWKERIVAAAAIALVGFVPLLAKVTAQTTTFAGTRAEALYEIERGGPDAAQAVSQVNARAQQGLAEFAELYVLGRYELRRGRLEAATELFKKAALERGEDARLLVNLGNARLGLADVEGAVTHYTRASELDPKMAAAFFNLSQIHYRKAATLQDAARALELEKAQTAQGLAHNLDKALLGRAEPPADVDLNGLVLSPPIAQAELDALSGRESQAGRVADQIAWRLLGSTAGPVTYALPLLIALAILGFGGLRWTLLASRGCERCGLPVCVRCDKDLAMGGGLCAQCVNVFARKAAVPPQVKVRKQIEVDRYQTRTARVSWVFGLLCSGAGHLFSGLPIRGAVFAFLFLFVVFLGVFRDGVLRAPYGEMPLLFRLVPAGIALVVVYFLSLRSLRKAQES